MPTLIEPNNKVAVTIHDKKILIKAHVFLILLIFFRMEYKSKQGIAYLAVIKNSIGAILLC